MEEFITVATFQYPHQAYIIKTKLESQGISVFLKDELTIQAHNFLSNAVGGVKLQIKESDLKTVLPVLTELGLMENKPTSTSGDMSWIDERTNRIPIIKKWPVEVRGIFIVAIILILLFTLVFIANLPSKEERLTQEKREQALKAKYELENYHLPKIDSLLDSEPKKAISYSKNLLESTYPKNGELYSMIAYGYIEIDSFKLSSKYFSASMTYGLRGPKSLSAIAYCQVQLENYDEAIRHLKEATSINRDYKIQLAEVYEMKEDWKNAGKYYSEYISDRESWDSNIRNNKEFQKLKSKRDSIRNINQ